MGIVQPASHPPSLPCARSGKGMVAEGLKRVKQESFPTGHHCGDGEGEQAQGLSAAMSGAFAVDERPGQEGVV